MGGKYEVRYRVVGEHQSWSSEYTNSFWEFLKLLWNHRGKVIYFKVFF